MKTNNSMFILILIVFFAAPFLFASEGVQMGDTMCDCPGVDKPLGNASSCEAACFGEPEPAPVINDEAQRHREEADRQAQEQQQAEIKQKEAAEFIRDRDASVGKLKGSSGQNTQLKGLSNSNSPGLKGKAKITTYADSGAVKKTLAALDCAVKSVLETIGSPENLQADLAKIKNIIRTPPSGKRDTYQIETISLSDIRQNKTTERQAVGSISVQRNELTGEIHIDVSQSTSSNANLLSRIFGKKRTTKESQNLLVIDNAGSIISKDVTTSVKKCLKKK